MKRSTKQFIPEGLSPLGLKVAKSILTFLEKKSALPVPGTKFMYSPEEWNEKGERYSRGALLNLIFEAETCGVYFSYDRYCYDRIAEMDKELENLGVHCEQGTIWYAGIYK